jgi:hypothetical protein
MEKATMHLEKVTHNGQRKGERKMKNRLPANAVRASKIERLVSTSVRMGAPDVAVATIKGRKHLASWGLNASRETVEKFGGRRFAYVGMVGERGIQRENYEELL